MAITPDQIIHGWRTVLGGIVLWGFIAVPLLLFLFICSWLTPLFSASSFDEAKYAEDRKSLAVLAKNYYGGQEVRVQQRFAGSVNLYISKEAYLDIPVPDRPAFKQLANYWCPKHKDGYARFVIRDIRSDDRIYSGWCLFYATLRKTQR